MIQIVLNEPGSGSITSIIYHTDTCTDLEGEAFRSIAQHKYLQDTKAQEIFGHLIEDEDFKQFMSDKESNTCPTNMRSLMITTKAFDEDCSYMQRLWDLRSAAAARLLLARGEVVNDVQMCICGAKLPKNVLGHLNTQAHKTNVRKKGIEDVPEEPVLAAGDVGVVPQLLLVSASRHVPRSSDAHPSRLQFEEEVFEQEELPEDSNPCCRLMRAFSLYSALHASISNKKQSKCACADTRSEYFYSVAMLQREAAAREWLLMLKLLHLQQHSTAQLSGIGSSIYGGVGPKNKDLQTVA
jgi:hypothetical protein